MHKVKLALVTMLAMNVLLTGCYGPAIDAVRAKKAEEIARTNPHRLDRWLENKIPEDRIDPHLDLEREDYYNLFFGPQPPNTANKEPRLKIPDLSELMVAPKPTPIADDKLVTLSVTDDVPLKDVLIELARRADIDMEIDPNITGGIIFRAKDKPFSQVIERLANLANLKYSVHNGVLRVERDVPIVKNYRMPLLNMVRTSNTSVFTATDLGGGGDGDGSSSGSTSQLSSLSENSDIWSIVEMGVESILTGTHVRAVEASAGGAPTTGLEVDPNAIPPSSILSINRQAGVVSVLATSKEHMEVKAYLDDVHKSHSSQVLIEAKVLEVTLDDEYRSGIDWSFTNSNLTEFSARAKFNKIDKLDLSSSLSDQLITVTALPSELFGLDETSLEAAVQLVEGFGTSRTLSNPRLHTMNNQFAMLTFAENEVYFELDVQEETEDSGGTGTGTTTTITVDSEINTVPIGVLLSLQPSIDLEREEITMSVRPTVTRISDRKDDPAVAFIAERLNITLTNQIPVIDIRELDSVLRLKSGQVMVIGGLMEERTVDKDRGVPSLSRVPIIGNAFKSVEKTSATVETVVFIKATIVPGLGVTVEDKDFYRRFTRDRHQLAF